MKKTIVSMLCVVAVFAACTGGKCKNAADGQCAHNDDMTVVLDLQRYIKPELIDDYKAAFAECRAVTITEEGCVSYGVYQSTEDSTLFLIHEVWANQAALDSHSASEHLKKLGEATSGMYAGEPNDMRIKVCPAAQDK